MRITAKVDYAVRAAIELAAVVDGQPLKCDEIATRQAIPAKFLEGLLSDMRRAGLLESYRGYAGGYWLARPAGEINVADVIRAVEGPLADVHGTAPEDLDFPAPAAQARELWVATRAALRDVLEGTTLAHLASGRLPRAVARRLSADDAWARRDDLVTP